MTVLANVDDDKLNKCKGHSHMFTRRERQKSASSLVCLLQALAGQCTRLELRNEIAITGTVIGVDCNMELVYKKHRFQTKIMSSFSLQYSAEECRNSEVKCEKSMHLYASLGSCK